MIILIRPRVFKYTLIYEANEELIEFGTMNNRRINLFVLLVFMLTAFELQVSAQTANEPNFVVLTKKVPQLQPILLAAEALKTEDDGFGRFEIIICGQEIGDITDPAKIDKFIKKASDLGVTIVACGFSLNKFKVDRDKVPSSMKIVENGILYNLQLQKKGFHSLGL